jgi:glutathione S-transferase
MPLPTLHQFRFSHFNEKARWTLDHKRLAHRRRSYLPGMHVLPIRRLTGQQQVPVLVDGERVIAGSAAIIAYLEEAHPQPALLPADPADRRRVLEVQRHFDEDIAGPLRAAAFQEWLTDGAYISRMFSTHARPAVRAAYRAAFPLVRVAMRATIPLSAERAAEGLARADEAFALVAEQAGPHGYLVGDRFTLADLTAAAILAPALMPPEFPYAPPQPIAPVVQAFLDRWKDHPGAAWVRDMYRRHRGPSAAVTES